jgi:predicted AAA+ superfamily ATPase
VAQVNHVPLGLLKSIEPAARQLLDNTRRFADGLPANDALLWGARGMGKSSLAKAVHAEIAVEVRARGQTPWLKLIEIHREDIASMPRCLSYLRMSEHRFIVFCDDLSFDRDDTSYKSLKAVLEGGIEGRPRNVVFYATSNRRHLMPRDMMENERSTAINPSESVEEKVSLSDRFGLWLGFQNCSQGQYLDMVRSYASHYRLSIEEDELIREALEWSMARGARSGRVAWQFTQDLAGRLGAQLQD